MSNTYSATLVTESLSKAAITVLQNKFSPLKAYATQVETDPIKPLAKVEVKHITAGGTTQTNATNFESGDSTIAAIGVTMNQYSQSFNVSNADLNNGLRIEDLARANAKALASKIQQVVNAVLTTTNFTATPIVSAPAGFGLSDLQSLYGTLKKADEKNLILDGDYFARITNQPGYYQPAGVVPGDGWRPFGWNFIGENTEWTGAGANVRGFACATTAIAAAVGVPLEAPNSKILTREIITIPGLEIQIAAHTWFAPASRSLWASYDVMFGAALGDASAGVLVKSA